jgi:hypothetical protein
MSFPVLFTDDDWELHVQLSRVRAEVRASMRVLAAQDDLLGAISEDTEATAALAKQIQSLAKVARALSGRADELVTWLQPAADRIAVLEIAAASMPAIDADGAA